MEIRTQKRTRVPECMQAPPKLYKEKLPISLAKKKDLISLCDSGIIPDEFHSYYQSLPAARNLKDKLPLEDDEDLEENIEDV